MKDEYDLRLDAANLHNDLEAIRIDRGTNGRGGSGNIPHNISEHEGWKINLIWDNDEHRLPVFVKGPAIAVEGFLTKQRQRINFAQAGWDSFERYDPVNDKGCYLELTQICGVLQQLEEGKHTRFLSKDRDARTAFVMCVFVASEIVRNEVLERILLKGDCGSWHDYLRLYQNWASVSAIINGCGADQFAEIIYGIKVGAELNKANPNAEVRELYGSLQR